MKKKFDPDTCPLAIRYRWSPSKRLQPRALEKKSDVAHLKLVPSPGTTYSPEKEKRHATSALKRRTQ